MSRMEDAPMANALLLTGRQADELHKSVISYLEASKFTKAAAELRAEAGLGTDVFDSATAKKYETLLSKKWTSVVRLQKKILDLESRNAALQSELDNLTPDALAKRIKDPSSWLPTARPRHTCESHRDTINCVAFHPVFTSVASGSDDYTIKIWDWELGELERTIKGHTRAVLDLDFGGPRGSVLMASCSSDLTIKLWDPQEDYKNIRSLAGHDHSVSAVRFIPNSANLLVSASRDHTLRIWDVATGFCLRTLLGHTDWVRDVTPSHDGRYLLSTGDDMTALLWDISNANSPEIRARMAGHENYNICCAIAPPAAYPYLAPLAGLPKNPAGSRAGGGGKGTPGRRDTAGGGGGTVTAGAAAEFMATGSRDKTIRLWSATGVCLKTLVGHDNWVRGLAFHPGGRYLLSVSDDKTLRCWDLSQDGKCVRVLDGAHERFVTCIRWAPSIPRRRQSGGDGTNGSSNGGTNGDVANTGAQLQQLQLDEQIRCVIVTGSVDMKLRVFAN